MSRHDERKLTTSAIKAFIKPLVEPDSNYLCRVYRVRTDDEDSLCELLVIYGPHEPSDSSEKELDDEGSPTMCYEFVDGIHSPLFGMATKEFEIYVTSKYRIKDL